MFPNQFNKMTVIKAHEYKQTRDIHSAAFHIEEKGKSLCGTETHEMYGKNPVTQQDVLETLMDDQHSGWHWCVTCASLFTGESTELFAKSLHIKH